MKSSSGRTSASIDARRRERRRAFQAAPGTLRRKGKVVVVDGYGVSVRTERGRLVVSDGAGAVRRERTFSRARHGIVRLVVLGGSGSISLAALRWCLDLGIPVVCVDRDGRILSLSAPGNGDVRLRRAQALAATNASGLTVARFLLGDKLRGHESVLRRLTRSRDDLDAYDDARRRLDEGETVDELLLAERDAALVYWRAWERVQVRFQGADARMVPEHWKEFTTRGSPLTSSPRSAINPANALLNLSYALLEAETRIACLAVGLDPEIGVVHADVRGRPSLALDLMEAIRPGVDGFVLGLVQSRVLSLRDFYETRQGVCRVLAPLSHEMAEMTPTWASLVAPIAERAASILAEGAPRIERVATPLTSENRRKANAARRRPRASHRQPPMTCKRCGEVLRNRDRTYCDSCAALPQEERYTSTLGLTHSPSDAETKVPSPEVTRQSSITGRTSRRCKRCGEPVTHRKRVLCDPCFVAFRAELAAQRRGCKECGEPTPHRKRALCDRCLSERAVSTR